MPATILLGDIVVNLRQKDIKNVHLSVYPPTGQVPNPGPTDYKSCLLNTTQY